MPWLKRNIVFPCAKIINYLFTGVRLTDVHNGFRVFTGAAAQKIQITQDRMAHNSEIVAQIKQNGLKYAEYPVEVFYHEYGQGAVGGIKILLDLIVSKIMR
jgi:polyprenyl-phospho-N-acetylgalactosaminyl synthase